MSSDSDEDADLDVQGTNVDVGSASKFRLGHLYPLPNGNFGYNFEVKDETRMVPIDLNRKIDPAILGIFGQDGLRCVMLPTNAVGSDYDKSRCKKHSRIFMCFRHHKLAVQHGGIGFVQARSYQSSWCH